MLRLTRPLVVTALAGTLALPLVGAAGVSAAGTTPQPVVAAAHSSTWPLLRSGSAGVDVRTAQHLLRHMNSQNSPVGDSGVLVVDGRFGPATRAAVVEFQRLYGLAADGVVGPRTWRALVETVGDDSRNEAVMGLQVQLAALGYRLTVDGVFGRRTEAAVREFQGVNGLAVDGVAGPATWRALLGRTGP